ncbi:unnamed protein product [Knipowitschia caucasica]
MSFILCYMAILTGHRSVVFTNLTKESVANADSWNSGTRFQVLVGDHKTTKSFGQAAIVLDSQEFDWLRLLATGSFCGDECEGATWVFHTQAGAQLKQPSSFIAQAWAAAGLKGTVTLNKIRSSVATQLSKKERRRVARAMCHDPATAAKFYVALPSRERQFEDRVLRLKALSLASNTRPERFTRPVVSSSSESEGPEPVYDDSPESSDFESLSPEPEPLRPESPHRLPDQLFHFFATM